jgi:hypothetical protein
MRLHHATKPFGVSLYHLGFGDMLEFIDPSWGSVPSLFFTMIYIYTYTHYIQVNQGINMDKPTSEIP